MNRHKNTQNINLLVAKQLLKNTLTLYATINTKLDIQLFNSQEATMFVLFPTQQHLNLIMSNININLQDVSHITTIIIRLNKSITRKRDKAQPLNQ